MENKNTDQIRDENFATLVEFEPQKSLATPLGDSAKTSSSEVNEEAVDIPTIMRWLIDPKDAPRVTLAMADRLRAHGLVRYGK